MKTNDCHRWEEDKYICEFATKSEIRRVDIFNVLVALIPIIIIVLLVLVSGC